MSYKVGSFNMHNLGLSALSEKNPRNLELIARIIKGENYDVVALQEILSGGKALSSETYAKKSLLMHLGSNWDFKWADAESSRSDPRNEGFAFIWNTRRLRLSTAKMPDGSIRTFYPRIWEGKNDALIRKPFYARFTPMDTPCGGPAVELRLVCIHAFYGDNKNPVDIATRQTEVRTILKEIYPQIAEKVHRNGIKGYTIVLGDYNLELQRNGRNAIRVASGVKLRDLPPALITDEGDIITAPNWGDYRILTAQDEPTTLKQPKEGQSERKLSVFEDGYANNFDHFSYDIEEVFKGVAVKIKRVDAVRKYCSGEFEKYYHTVSDHVPIYMEIDFRNGR